MAVGFLLQDRTSSSARAKGAELRQPAQNEQLPLDGRPLVKNNPHEADLTYESLPCPTEQEFQAWAQELKLVIPEGPSLDVSCEKNFRSQLGKIFKLMKTLEFNLPPRWPLSFRESIEKSFEFLKSHTSKLTLDLNQQGSIAYNIVSKKEIGYSDFLVGSAGRVS